MTAQQRTVFVLVCDHCNETILDAEYGSELVAETVDRIREIAEDALWSRDGDDDLCPTCMCARHDHQRRLSANGTYAYCERCDVTLVDAVTAEPKAAFL